MQLLYTQRLSCKPESCRELTHTKEKCKPFLPQALGKKPKKPLSHPQLQIRRSHSCCVKCCVSRKVLGICWRCFLRSHLALGIPVMLPRGNRSVAQLESLTEVELCWSPSLHSDTLLLIETLSKSTHFTVKMLSLIRVSAFKNQQTPCCVLKSTP